ncbi:MAG: type 2 isopentenyl-diphosphate Delta-isomerase [Microbacteriaceae bacterium]|nr:type 2 isopentenyl-diphosphate Delta-isomerase [Microbacteriaceae bacterium]
MNAEVSLAASRKEDHIDFALAQQTQAKPSDFDCVEFLHHALGGINIAEVDLAQEIAGKTWQHPLYINAMTGGTERAGVVNRTLAEAAAETGVAVAAGSLGIALDNPETAPSFRVLREANPQGFVFANIGAGRPVSDALRAVELLQADALQIHVNAAQETVMPEGSRNFGDWLDGIAEIAASCPVPVVVKEVGFGLSKRTLSQLREIGVRFADVSGRGGTDFALIEAGRRDDGYADLAGFGQSAVVSLLDAPADFGTLFASGGVRSPLDAVKLLALGAQAVGVAGHFLQTAISGDSAKMAQQLRWWLERTRELCALLGAKSVADLRRTDVLLRGEVREFCELRGVAAAGFARRSEEK